MTRFKICGLRDSGNALVAAEAGADFLGFVFVEGVRRQLTLEQTKAIVDEYRDSFGDGGPKLVGLFLDQPIELVNRAVEECGLDMAQLCGEESPKYWATVAAPVIKQIKVRDDDPRKRPVSETESRIMGVESAGQTPQLDKHIDGHVGGGTGVAFDWNIASELAPRHDFLLAGGLNPENVRQAIGVVHPWGVDVSSGVETEGVKDARKIRAFADAVKQADSNGAEAI